MIKLYEQCMKYETNIYKSICKKTAKQLESGEIDVIQLTQLCNKRGTGGPIYDVYNRMNEFNNGFPWDEDYNTMIDEINRENKYFGIEDIGGFLQVFRCSLILYDQYKQLGKEDFLDYLQLIGIKYSDSRKNILESLIDVCKNYNTDVKENIKSLPPIDKLNII